MRKKYNVIPREQPTKGVCLCSKGATKWKWGWVCDECYNLESLQYRRHREQMEKEKLEEKLRSIELESYKLSQAA